MFEPDFCQNAIESKINVLQSKRNKKFGRKGTTKLIRNKLQEKEINKIRIAVGNIKEQ